jgi:hypothetical protein
VVSNTGKIFSSFEYNGSNLQAMAGHDISLQIITSFLNIFSTMYLNKTINDVLGHKKGKRCN